MATSLLTAPASRIAAQTPRGHDRYLDLLRALAIGAVVVGHWLVAVLWLDEGQLRAAAAVDLVPATRWLTWIFQVMPLFFLVGGVVNARSWRATRTAGGAYGAWLTRRAARLLRPTVVLVWTWLGLAPLARVAGVDPALVELGARNALVPLWFLGVYLLLIALVPTLLAAWDRLGLWLPAGCLAAAAAVDAGALAALPGLAVVNYLLVWSVPTALGFAWTDGHLDRPAVRIALPLVAVAGLVVAIAVLGYPVSMVGLAEQDTGGPNVPLATLALLGGVQATVAVAARDRVTAWLARPRPWATVARATSVAMTVYLWHVTVLVLAAGALSVTGDWWSVAPLGTAWWATRPLWIAGLGVLLAPVVVVLLPVERSVPRTRAPRRGATAVGAMALAAAAIAAVTLHAITSPVAVAGGLGLGAAAVHVGAFVRSPGSGVR
jgi:peptidoglycan/LPS O-acetylase OafA/YrhL